MAIVGESLGHCTTGDMLLDGKWGGPFIRVGGIGGAQGTPLRHALSDVDLLT